MATFVSLNCAHCGKEFSMSKSDYSRRKWKLPDSNFFCSRSCSSSYNNQFKELPKGCVQPGNQNNRKYDRRFSWYVTRMGKDQRKSVKYVGDKKQLADHLQSVWTAQNGKCAISGSSLILHCDANDDTNPFLIASVDRIDSSKPYEFGNLQFISRALNLAKNDYDDQQFARFFREWVDSVAHCASG